MPRIRRLSKPAIAAVALALLIGNATAIVWLW